MAQPDDIIEDQPFGCALTVLCFAILFLVGGLGQLKVGSQIKDWKTTEGLVESSYLEEDEDGFYQAGSFLYSAHGHIFRGLVFEIKPKALSFAQAESRRRNKFGVGRKVRVRFDPEHRLGAHLKDGEPGNTEAWVLVGFGLIFGIPVSWALAKRLGPGCLLGFALPVVALSGLVAWRFDAPPPRPADTIVADEEDSTELLRRVSKVQAQSRKARLENASKLEAGQTLKEVLQLLGAPNKLTLTGEKLHLGYQDFRLIMHKPGQEFLLLKKPK